MSHTINFEKINESESVIRLSGLKNAIEEKRKELDEKIIQEWMDCITREYICEKIVEAEVRGQTSVILIEQYGSYETVTNLYQIYNRNDIKNRICEFLEPSIHVFVEATFNAFRIRISWGSFQTCVIF